MIHFADKISLARYMGYRYNRSIAPEITPKSWALIYGDDVFNFEEQYQKEIAAMRIYEVTDGKGLKRMVRAHTKAGAIRFVAEELFNASVANQESLVAHVANGKEIENAIRQEVGNDAE